MDYFLIFGFNLVKKNNACGVEVRAAWFQVWVAQGVGRRVMLRPVVPDCIPPRMGKR